MTKRKDILLLYTLIFVELLILINSKLVINSVISASGMFILKIFPSLFPTMVIGLCLIKCNVNIIIPKMVKTIFRKLFNFDDHMTSIFVMSMIAGSPSNAIFINNYLDAKLINEKTANNLLCCTHFINPLFVIGGVGVGVFNSFKIGLSLLIIMYVSNLVKAFILRKNFSPVKNIRKENESINFVMVFQNSVKSSINSLLMILGIVTMFNILVTLIGNIFDLSPTINCVVNGLLEMTGGVMKLSSASLPRVLKVIMAYYFLLFGGICIQMQTLSMIDKIKIRYFKYLIFRLF